MRLKNCRQVASDGPAPLDVLLHFLSEDHSDWFAGAGRWLSGETDGGDVHGGSAQRVEVGVIL